MVFVLIVGRMCINVVIVEILIMRRLMFLYVVSVGIVGMLRFR